MTTVRDSAPIPAHLLAETAQRWHDDGRIIVFTNGVFDLLQ